MSTEQSYYGTVRSDLFPYIPEGADSILDLGCGEGATIKALKERGHEYVAGVEIDSTSRMRADKHADRVFDVDLSLATLDAREYFIRELGRKFNVVLMGDVLEHLVYPSNLLVTLKDVLADDGIIVLSVPNAGWIGAIEPIWNQTIPYADRGHFDYGHVRFYCKGDLRKLFETHGYEVLKLESLRMSGDMPEYVDNMSLSMGEPPNQVIFNGVTRDRFDQMFTYQWVCVVRKHSS